MLPLPRSRTTTCAGCPQNAWGSRITPAGKKAKACADSKRVAVSPLGDIRNEAFGGPMMLRVPAASLVDFANYGDGMDARGYQYYAVGTKMSFDSAEVYPKLVFEPIRPLNRRRRHRSAGAAGVTCGARRSSQKTPEQRREEPQLKLPATFRSLLLSHLLGLHRQPMYRRQMILSQSPPAAAPVMPDGFGGDAAPKPASATAEAEEKLQAAVPPPVETTAPSPRAKRWPVASKTLWTLNSKICCPALRKNNGGRQTAPHPSTHGRSHDTCNTLRNTSPRFCLGRRTTTHPPTSTSTGLLIKLGNNGKPLWSGRAVRNQSGKQCPP